MKAVLMSIHHKWCEKIFNGSKTIEVRKSRPSIDMPFKVYVYETKGKTKYWSQPMPIPYTEGRGKVIGEFVCDRIICCQAYYDDSGKKHLTNLFGVDTSKICLSELEIFDYIIGKDKKDGIGWLWHITDLKIYDKPKELSEFRKVCLNGKCSDCIYEECKITRPPQSWCYVEELQ
mgnify:CR=1 FL=1